MLVAFVRASPASPTLSLNRFRQSHGVLDLWDLARVRQVTNRHRPLLLNHSSFDTYILECRPHLSRPLREFCFLLCDISLMHGHERPCPRSRLSAPAIVFGRGNSADLPTVPSFLNHKSSSSFFPLSTSDFVNRKKCVRRRFTHSIQFV